SYTEKTDERKSLQKEISSLNTKLDQRQEDLLRAQKRESMLAELRENQKPKKEEDAEDDLQAKEASSDTAAETATAATADGSQSQPQGSVIADTGDGTVILKEDARPNETQGGVSEKEQTVETEDDDDEKTEAADSDPDANATLSGEEMRAMISADTSAQLASRQGTIVTKTEDGIAILKGEIAQDERRGVNTERKQAELEKMEKQEERAMAFQFSELGKAMNVTNPAAETNVTGIEKTAQDDPEHNAYTTTIRASQEEQEAQQRFQVSIA
ncbi:MAG: hypothetical protein K2N00_07805, partial [Lachnospiraceae bacterium]|nr:hypothetical protein [Lachnospiraceae bacterium]